MNGKLRTTIATLVAVTAVTCIAVPAASSAPITPVSGPGDVLTAVSPTVADVSRGQSTGTPSKEEKCRGLQMVHDAALHNGREAAMKNNWRLHDAYMSVRKDAENQARSLGCRWARSIR